MVGDLKRRGLLQVDRVRREYDLHPVVRGYAVQSLTPDARAESAQRVADYFASRASTPYEEAVSLADLQNGVQVAQALALAGKPQAAWEALSSGLLEALIRLELPRCARLAAAVLPRRLARAAGGVENLRAGGCLLPTWLLSQSQPTRGGVLSAHL